MRRELVLGTLAVLLIIGMAVFHQTRSPRSAIEAPPVLPVPDSGATLHASIRHIPEQAVQAAPAPPKPDLLALLMQGKTNLQVSTEQLQEYLEKDHRNVESLLGAYRTTRDTNLLREAAEKFPKDPRVAFDSVFFGPADERRKWLDTLKEAAPDNALGNYLSAADYLKNGQRDLALQELQAADGKAKYSDYSMDFMENAEEAYRAAGYPDGAAQIAADTQLLLPQLAQLKADGVGLVDLAKSYQESGDTASAQTALQLAMNLGQRLDQPDSLTLIQPLVGIAIQKLALNAMDASDPTTQDELVAMTQEREAIRNLNTQFQSIVSAAQQQDSVPEPEVIAYFQRQKLFGAQAAMQWAVNRYGQK